MNLWATHRSFAVVVVATAAMWSTHEFVGGWTRTHEPPREHHSIDGLGIAKRHLVGDHIKWDATVEARAPDCDRARAQLARNMTAARDYLLAQGLLDTELTFQAATCDRETRPVQIKDEVKDVDVGALASQNFEIASADVARGLRVYREAVVGLNVASMRPPTCGMLEKQADPDMLREARNNARAEAEAAASALGGRLGRLISADSPSTPMFGTYLADFCTGAETSLTVRAVYELE